jgi:hypothetical protein
MPLLLPLRQPPCETDENEDLLQSRERQVDQKGWERQLLGVCRRVREKHAELPLLLLQAA